MGLINRVMKARVILPVVYGALFVAALIWMFANAKQTPFCGVPLVCLTQPWSIFAFLICDAISPRLFSSSLLVGTLILSFCGLLNGGIAFLIGAGIDRLWRGKNN